MKVKEGAKLKGIKAEIILGALLIAEVFKKYGVELVITEGTGGKHMAESLHYSGLALDIRAKNIPENMRERLMTDCVLALGSNYDIVSEKEDTPDFHWHLEFDPK